MFDQFDKSFASQLIKIIEKEADDTRRAMSNGSCADWGAYQRQAGKVTAFERVLVEAQHLKKQMNEQTEVR